MHIYAHTVSRLTPCCVSAACRLSYLSQEINQCEGIELPFEQEKARFTPTAWTVKLEKATIYAAYAQAYVPPLSDFMDTASLRRNLAAYYAHTSGPKPACGVSLAVVGHGKLYDQRGLLAGTADVTSKTSISGAHIPNWTSSATLTAQVSVLMETTP